MFFKNFDVLIKCIEAKSGGGWFEEWKAKRSFGRVFSFSVLVEMPVRQTNRLTGKSVRNMS